MIQQDDNIHNSKKQEILLDLKNGKVTPWQVKKMSSLKVAQSYGRLGFQKKYDRICSCGDYLEFAVNSSTMEMKLKTAYFCRERLCSMCIWRKSLKVFHELSQVVDEYKTIFPSHHGIMLNLTVKNCYGDNLKITVDKMMLGWKNLSNQRIFKKAIKGWFRSLEITYNKETSEFHPHFHCILFVDKDYYKEKYIDIYEWVQLWKSSLGIEYDPITWVEKIKTNKRKKSIIAELSKYVVKDKQILVDSDDKQDEIILFLTSALRGRRIYAFGGDLKEIAKKLGKEDLEQGDLIQVGDEIRTDIFDMIERYRWNIGYSNYYKI